MDALNCFSAADNTTLQLGSGSNICTGPNDCVADDRARADTAFRAENREPFDARGGIDQSAFCDRVRPIRLRQVSRFPAALVNGPMHPQIFTAGPDVEPL